MSNPSAFVLFDASAKLHIPAILHSLEERHPDQSIASISGDRGDTGATLLNLSGVTVALMQFGSPLPAGWQAAASRAAIHWSEAEAVFSRHSAHVAVHAMGESNDRLHLARVITAVTGAIVEICPRAIAVLWDLAVANASSVFAEFSRSAFSPYPDLPSGLWVSLQPFRDQGSHIGALTVGLRNFIGREIELEGQTSQLKSVLITARGLADYLLKGGTTLKDGDTIGASESERIRVELKVSDRFDGLPVIAAVMPAR